MPTRYQTTLLNAATATGAGAFIQGDDRLPSFATFQVTITGTATVTFQGNTDGTTTYQTIPVTSVAASPVTANTVTASGIYRCDLSAAQIRPNVTAYTNGTVTVVVSVSQGTLSGGASSGSSGGSVTVSNFPATQPVSVASGQVVAGAFADGAITTIGTEADAPQATTTTTSPATLITIEKGIYNALTAVPTNPPPFQLEKNDGTPVGDTAAHAMFVSTGGSVAIGSSSTGILPSFVGGQDASGNVQSIQFGLLNSSPTLSTQEAQIVFGLLGVKAGNFMNPLVSLSGLTTPDGGTGTQSLSVGIQVYNGASWDRLRSANGDAQANTGLLSSAGMVWNGTTWDRMPGTTTGVKVVPQAGELHLGEVGGNSLSLESTLTVTASAYSAGNNVGGLVTLTNAMRKSGGTGVLQNILVVDHSNQKPNLDIIFFTSTPAATFTDKSAFPTLAQADDALVICRVSIAAGDWVTIGGSGFASPSFQPKVVAATGSANLLMALNTSSTPTFAATTDIMVTTGFLRD
jgi:hypothetical protein